MCTSKIILRNVRNVCYGDANPSNLCRKKRSHQNLYINNENLNFKWRVCWNQNFFFLSYTFRNGMKTWKCTKFSLYNFFVLHFLFFLLKYEYVSRKFKSFCWKTISLSILCRVYLHFGISTFDTKYKLRFLSVERCVCLIH